MTDYQFTGKKPSQAQVLKILKQKIKEGHNMISISWGENMVEFQKYNNTWFGSGWIKNISGQDLAKML